MREAIWKDYFVGEKMLKRKEMGNGEGKKERMRGKIKEEKERK